MGQDKNKVGGCLLGNSNVLEEGSQGLDLLLELSLSNAKSSGLTF